MQTHHLPILNPENCPTFTMIKSGVKTVEGRVLHPQILTALYHLL